MQPIKIPQEALEKLHKRKIECFELSERSILKNPETFREIKRRLLRISIEPIDIDEYFCTAYRLAQLLKKMGPATIFTSYFDENIDPNLNGKAYFFRTECIKLLEQIEELNTWRKNKRKMALN
jgi:hypothetical protein